MKRVSPAHATISPMAKKSARGEVSLYLWYRIKVRMETLGISPKELSDKVGQSEPNISRLLNREVEKIAYLPILREELKLPDDELEKRWKSYVDDILDDLARVMAASPQYAESFMEDVSYLAKLYKDLDHIHTSVKQKEVEVRSLKGQPEQAKAIEEYGRMKQRQAKLEKIRRQLVSLLS